MESKTHIESCFTTLRRTGMLLLVFLVIILEGCVHTQSQNADKNATGTETHQWTITETADWHEELHPAINVTSNAVLSYSTDIKLKEFNKETFIFICLRFYNAEGKTVADRYAPLMPDYTNKKWQTVKGECLIPPGIHSAALFLSGRNACELETKNSSIVMLSKDVVVPTAAAREAFTLSNNIVKIIVDPVRWAFEITDTRCGKTWDTFPAGQQIILTDVQIKSPSQAIAKGIYRPANAPVTLDISLKKNEPELSLHVSMPEETPMPIWAAQLSVSPTLFADGADGHVAIPLGEGFLFPSQDKTVPSLMMQLADGRGSTMPFSGVVDMKTGAAAMWFTQDEDDALATLYWHHGEKADKTKMAGNAVSLNWMSQKDRWGYDRTLHYWFADKGSYVALAKRYRKDAQDAGKFVTLKEKQKKLPQLEQFRGTPVGWFNFLYWIEDKEERLAQMKWLYDQGVTKMLYSSGEALDDFTPLHEWGWLTTRYDNYEDMWPPEQQKKAHVDTHQIYHGIHDIRKKFNGEYAQGWVQRTPHGEFPGYLLCGEKQKEFAEKYIPGDLKKRPYKGRFIDVTTACPLYECYNDRHPMTRGDDKAARRDLLEYIGDMNLICGSEIGCDWAVPELCYSEGMLSPVPFRNPNAGSLAPDMQPVPETYKYQLNPAVRIPLWELVYHECVVAYWYWGDTQNTFPELWNQRNLFNALYAVPALYMMQHTQQWTSCKHRIVETEKQLAPVFDAVEWEEMTDHAFLSEDRLLQSTKFADGAEIIVNFSDEERRHNAHTIAPKDFIVIKEND